MYLPRVNASLGTGTCESESGYVLRSPVPSLIHTFICMERARLRWQDMCWAGRSGTKERW